MPPTLTLCPIFGVHYILFLLLFLFSAGRRRGAGPGFIFPAARGTGFSVCLVGSAGLVLLRPHLLSPLLFFTYPAQGRGNQGKTPRRRVSRFCADIQRSPGPLKNGGTPKMFFLTDSKVGVRVKQKLVEG